MNKEKLLASLISELVKVALSIDGSGRDKKRAERINKIIKRLGDLKIKKLTQ